MKKYQPNFSDPRVIARIKHAYGFVKGTMSVDKPTNWSSRVIDKHFGRSNNQLGKYLRGILLICTNDRYDMFNGKCKEYKINERGLNLVRDVLLGNRTNIQMDINDNNSTTISPSVQHLFDRQVIYNFCMKEYGEQLSSLNFIYKDKSNRLWNPIQNFNKENKKFILAENGLGYNYDIECCAPTLILQHSQHLGNDLWLEALNEYLCNKHEVRTRISNELELDSKQVKILINALFCGARIGNSPQFATYYLLDQDTAKITWAKQDPYMIQLRQDIKTCWEYIQPNYPMRYKDNRKLPMSSRQKWSIYFQQERLVLNQVCDYLNQSGNRCFLEHDGFVTEHKINEEELRNYIMDRTNYSVNFKLESTDIEDNNSTIISPSVQQVGENK